MIRKIYLIALLVFNFGFSQENYNDSIKKVIEKDFEDIKIQDFKNLVPFHTSEGVGFLNATNNKVVLKSTYSDLDFSKPNIKGRYERIFFEIDSKTKNIKIFDDNFMVFGLGSSSRQNVKKDSNINKGFIVDSENEKIKSYSSVYSSEPRLFKYKGKYCAVVSKDGKYGVIDSDGETLEGLGFDYISLDKFDLGNDIFWFKYKNAENQEGYVNINGEKRLVNNLIKDSTSKTSGFFNFIDTESSITREYYGYSIESNEELCGVFDLVNSQWLIKPQKKLRIIDINYSTEETLSEKYDVNDRKKLKFYFLISDGNVPKDYYVDSKLVKYRPSK